MFNVCPGCGEYCVEKTVEPKSAGTALAICPQCGHGHPFRRQPLFIVTGASGTGKTTVALRLGAVLPECIVLDGDILWCKPFEELEVSDADAHPFRSLWLRMAKNVGQAGRPVVLFGSALPEQFEASPERRYFARIHYLTFVCNADVLDQRLHARPAWRKSGMDEVRQDMQNFNRWLQENASTTAPPMAVIDTTSMSIEAAVDSVAQWIRGTLATGGAMPPSGSSG
jgi:predicted kinase